MTEAELTRKIRARLNQEPKTFFAKIHGGPHGVKGFPDLVGVHHGDFVALEVKKPGKEKTLTKIQAHTLDQLRKCGAVVKVVTSPEEALEVLEDMWEWGGKEKYR